MASKITRSSFRQRTRPARLENEADLLLVFGDNRQMDPATRVEDGPLHERPEAEIVVAAAASRSLQIGEASAVCHPIGIGGGVFGHERGGRRAVERGHEDAVILALILIDRGHDRDGLGSGGRTNVGDFGQLLIEDRTDFDLVAVDSRGDQRMQRGGTGSRT